MKTKLIPLIMAAGLLVGCNRSVETASTDFNTLPPAVQKSIRAEAPNAEITSISKTSQNGTDAYKVDLKQDGKDSQMIVGMDGSVISSDSSTKQNGVVSKVEKALTPTGAVGTKFSALPEKVQATIQAKAPNAEIANVTKHDDNGRVVYENPTMQIAEDGTLVQDLQK
jgi:uncharacterized membrane protein YkoI